jgi:hypothetical protein
VLNNRFNVTIKFNGALMNLTTALVLTTSWTTGSWRPTATENPLKPLDGRGISDYELCYGYRTSIKAVRRQRNLGLRVMLQKIRFFDKKTQSDRYCNRTIITITIVLGLFCQKIVSFTSIFPRSIRNPYINPFTNHFSIHS